MLGYMHERDICTVHVVIKAMFVFVYEREEGDHALIHAPLCGGSELVRERKRGREEERKRGRERERERVGGLWLELNF